MPLQFKSPKFLDFKYSRGMYALPTSFVFFSLCLCYLVVTHVTTMSQAPTWQAARRKLDNLSVSTLGTAAASKGSLLSLPKESQKTSSWALSSHAATSEDRGHMNIRKLEAALRKSTFTLDLL